VSRGVDGRWLAGLSGGGRLYTIHRIKITAEGGLGGFKRIDAFPLDYWTPERAHECDYLFVPAAFSLP